MMAANGGVSEAEANHDVDVVVVGGGNAGFCAAQAARRHGARVLIVEKAPEVDAGGNSFYTAGAFRVVHGGAEALRPVLDDDETIARLDRTTLDPYTAEEFRGDIERLTEGRNDPAMTQRLVDDSVEVPAWLRSCGIRWRLMYERQAYETDGRWRFWGGLALGVVDGGKGLVAQHTAGARRSGIEIRYGTACTGLTRHPGGLVTGITVRDDGGEHHLAAGAVVLTAGGFESDPERRARHLGPRWRHAVVRGTPANTGEVLDAALGLGAAAAGDWGSAHAVAVDADAAPDGGDRTLTNQLTRQSYPLGIVVNVRGERFLDEGADFRNYTYATYGARILAQPDGLAFQLFDARTRPLLRAEEYESRPIAAATADDLRTLAHELGVDADGLERTVRAFNDSIVDLPFDPTVKDGRAARTEPPKSNWANPLDTPPFYGFAVRCGITFTFGGLAIDGNARVLDTSGRPIDGLYAAGEMAGGLFSVNYPGGSGLTAGSVFGRRAGDHAGRQAADRGRRR